MFTIPKIISLLDLTRLNDDDTVSAITELCQKASTPLGNVAAVCVYPQFVALAKSLLKNSAIKIATVANFPSGDQKLELTLEEINHAVQAGADELDIVLPYKNFLAGEVAYVKNYLRSCRQGLGKNKILKVILETGALVEKEVIEQAAALVIEIGAEFIKTSTGKIKLGANEEAAEAILRAIQKKGAEQKVGIKISGGVRTRDQAENYLSLIEKKMGNAWINPDRVRLGASSLLGELLAQKDL